MLVKMSEDSQWNLCSDLHVSRSSISTKNQISKKRNHPCISVHLVHIRNISRTYGFDNILPDIYKHGIQRRNQFLFLLKIDILHWKLGLKDGKGSQWGVLVLPGVPYKCLEMPTASNRLCHQVGCCTSIKQHNTTQHNTTQQHFSSTTPSLK